MALNDAQYCSRYCLYGYLLIEKFLSKSEILPDFLQFSLEVSTVAKSEYHSKFFTSQSINFFLLKRRRGQMAPCIRVHLSLPSRQKFLNKKGIETPPPLQPSPGPTITHLMPSPSIKIPYCMTFFFLIKLAIIYRVIGTRISIMHSYAIIDGFSRCRTNCQ